MYKRFIHNNQKLKDRRRLLRNYATKEEKILWFYLKNKKLGRKFFRQHSIGTYIVDFYCAENELIIEIDGSQHSEKENALYDLERTKYFEELGYKVLRFWNVDINSNLLIVIKNIEILIESKLDLPSCL